MDKEELIKKYEKLAEMANHLASEIYGLENAKVLNKEASKIVSNYSSQATEMFYYFMNSYLTLKNK